MKIICEKKILYNSINNVQKGVAYKSTIPILNGILIKTENNKLILIGNNSELCIKSIIDVNIIQEGSIVLPSKIFGEIVRKLPDGNITIETSDNFITSIKCNHSKFELIGLDPMDFPEMPVISSNNIITVYSKVFDNLIKKTIFSVMQEEIKPVFTGELLNVSGNQIRMVALDGNRLAVKNDNLKQDYKECKLIIPGKNLSEISKILSDLDEDINIIFDDKNVQINTNNTIIMSRLLSGNFLDYQKVIPDKYKTRVLVNKDDILDSIERVSIILKEEKNSAMRMSINNDKIILTSNSQQGRVYEEVSAKVDGDEIELGFNSMLFLEILRVIDDEEIYLEFTSNIRPCIIKPVNGESFLYFIFPVKLAN